MKIRIVEASVELRKTNCVKVTEYDDIIATQPKGFKTDIACGNCGEALVVREGHSKFLGCSGYPECRMTYSRENYVPIDMRIHSSVINAAFGPNTDRNGDPWDNDMDDYPLGMHCADDIKMN